MTSLDATDGREPSDDASPGAPTTTQARVLVVDDSAAIRELIAVNLRLEGFDVAVAEDGEAALAIIKQFAPAVVTLDVVMPRLGGLETAQRLRADPATAGIGIVMVTGRTQPADRALAEDAGVDVFVPKPFEPNELIDVVNRLLQRSDTATEQ
ncbi:MAG TPA: response regulator [Nocardioidaceae bacterium]|nr:response regulator [Nocardioidaceae bacterium]